MGAGAGFGVILYAEERQRFVPEAGDGIVVQVDVADFSDVGVDGVGIDTEPVVVRGDFDFLRAQILNWLVSAAVAKFEFVGGSAERKAEHLVTKTNSKGWKSGFDERHHGFYDVRYTRRVAGAVGDEQAVGFTGENFLGGRAIRKDAAFAVEVVKNAELVEFDPAIEHRDAEFGIRLSAFGVGVGFVDGDFGGEVAPDEAFGGFGFFDQTRFVEVYGGDDTLHRALVADVQSDGAGVDLINTDDSSLFQIVGQRHGRAPVARDSAAFTNHQPFGEDGARFHIFGVYAVIPYKRIGHGDDLTIIGGIG